MSTTTTSPATPPSTPTQASPIYGGAIQQSQTANEKRNDNTVIFTAPVTPATKGNKLATSQAPRLSNLNQFYGDAPSVSPTDAPSGSDASSPMNSQTASSAALNQLIQLLTGSNATDETAASSTSSTTGSTSSSASSNDSGSAAMIQLAALITQLQVVLTQVLTQINANETSMNQAALSAAQANQIQVSEQIEQIEKQKHNSSLFGWIMDSIQIFVALLTFPASPVTSALMLAMVGTQIAQQQGTIPNSWTGNAWGDAFLKLGITLAAAGLAGGVTALINRATQTAAAAAESGAARAASAADDVGANAAPANAAEVENGAVQNNQPNLQIERVEDDAIDIQPADELQEPSAAPTSKSKTSAWGAATTAGGIALGTLNPIGSFSQAAGSPDVLQVLSDVINMLISLYLAMKGGAMMQQGGSGQLLSHEVIQGTMKAAMVGEMVSSAFGIYSGVIKINQAQMQKVLAELTKDQKLIQTVSNLWQNDEKTNGSFSNSTNNNLYNLQQLIAQFMQPQQAATQALIRG